MLILFSPHCLLLSCKLCLVSKGKKNMRKESGKMNMAEIYFVEEKQFSSLLFVNQLVRS